MTEPQAAFARSLDRQIAEDLGKKAGRDAVETILRTLRLTDSQLIRLVAGVSASTSVLAIPLAVMMQRRDKSPEEVVDALFDMIRPQLIGAAGLYVDGRGKPLPNRAEPEQAFVIRRMLVHYLRDPATWRAAFSEELEAVIAYARATRANGGAA